MDTLNEKAKIDKDVLIFFLDNFEKISEACEISLGTIATAMVMKNSEPEDWQKLVLELFCRK
tara:strand:+ start:201 stop:386 length:186 start_codon:yes stop_codon:yes gene_type:complete